MNGRSMTAALLVLAACLLALPASAQVDCDILPHWSGGVPSVNQWHIFCGEFNGARLKGFHSRPGGQNPNSVGLFTITRGPNTMGIYEGIWESSDPDAFGLEKRSTMFPDACTRDQVLESIRYAKREHMPCPQGAPRWARCGLNRPPDGTFVPGAYCDAGGGRFIIAMGLDMNDPDKVNTAFPLM
jgi:hypothetical protein